MRTTLVLIGLLTIVLYDSYAQGFSSQLQNRFQFILDSFQNNPANPFVGGMSAAIKIDGVADWKSATGFAARNVDANNNLLPGGTKFEANNASRMYSVTKTFTAALVLELAEQGMLNLNDPISKFIPVAAINPGLNTEVTLHQLLIHESGYSDYTSEVALQVAVAFNPAREWTPFEMLYFVHQMAAPGAQRRYSSTNYVLLGAIIEIATGKQVQTWLREKYIEPLELPTMYMPLRESQGKVPASLVVPHENLSPFSPIFAFTGQPTFPDAYTNISAFPMNAIVSLAFTGGALVSDVEDMARWGNALYSGKAISAGSLTKMLKSISPTPDPDGDRLGYGIILSNKISGSYDFIGHDGNAPGYRSVLFYHPGKKLTIAIMTNYHGADLFAVARALYNSIPAFTCGDDNRKDDKIQLCMKGSQVCVARQAAAALVKSGAFIGDCNSMTDASIQKPLSMIPVNTPVSIKVAPNPFHSQVTIQTGDEKIVSYKLIDMQGRQIYRQSVQGKTVSSQFHINGNSLRAGVYQLVFELENGTFQTVRLVKN